MLTCEEIMAKQINPDCPLDFWVSQNQGVVGRVLSRHVGLKPDLRSKGQSGINSSHGFAQQGFVLVEAMVAILIFSMGVLAIVGLQAAMIKNTSDAKFRADASFIAQQRIGMMWSDPVNTAAGAYLENNTDISALLPGGTRTVTQPVAGQFVVTITWQQPGEGQHSYTTIATIKETDAL